MERKTLALVLSVLPALVASTDSIREDPVDIDSDLQVEHLYKTQWPAGIAVTSSGRKFSCFPSSDDEMNVYNGSDPVYQVAELTGFDTETAYPDELTNSPPGGCIDTTGPFPVSKGLPNYFLSVQSIIVDRFDDIYALDTGRCRYNGVVTESSPGGPKLVKIDSNTNSIVRTFTFPDNVVFPISYLLDVALDIPRNNVAYISDGNTDNRNAIIVLFLDSGESFRRLENDFTVQPCSGFLPFVWGDPVYSLQTSPSGIPIGPTFTNFGVDGLAVSPDFGTLYYSPFSSRFLYSVPTNLILDRNVSVTEISAAVQNLGEIGFKAGLAASSNGTVFGGQNENDGVTMYNPETGYVVLLVHDKRINFVDRLALVPNKIYFIDNQFNYLPQYYPGYGNFSVDRRQRPFVLFSYPLPEGQSEGTRN